MQNPLRLEACLMGVGQYIISFHQTGIMFTGNVIKIGFGHTFPGSDRNEKSCPTPTPSLHFYLLFPQFHNEQFNQSAVRGVQGVGQGNSVRAAFRNNTMSPSKPSSRPGTRTPVQVNV